MPILYHPNGMPHNIPESEVKFALLRGLRYQPPVVEQQQLQPVITSATPVDEEKKQDLLRLSQQISMQNLQEKSPEEKSSEGTQPESSDAIKVNIATLKEMVAVPNIPTAVARKLMQNRPYGSIEDLIAKIPEFDWTTLASRLDYNAT